MNKLFDSARRSLSSSREMYQDGVGREALQRAGENGQLKGVVHEILYRDRKNVESLLRGKGEITRLTRSQTARTVDLVTTREGRIVSREQLKDVTSAAGIRKTLEQIRSGQYRSARLVGTEETTSALARSTKPVRSSGISSSTTRRIADNTGVRVRDRSLLEGNFREIGSQAAWSGALSGLAGTVDTALRERENLRQGRIDTLEYTRRVAVGGIGSAAKSGAKTASALALKEGAKAAAKATGKSALRRAAGSTAATAVVFGLVEQASDTIDYYRGAIDGETYKKRSAENAGGTGGAIAGAAAGAAIGSVIPVVGTGIGAVVGGMIGSIGGRWGAGSLFD
jgi:hypothetical protein